MERACTRCGNHSEPDGRFCSYCSCCFDCGLDEVPTSSDDVLRAAVCDCGPLPLAVCGDLRLPVALHALRLANEGLWNELDEARCLTKYGDHCTGEFGCKEDCEHEAGDYVGDGKDALCAVCSNLQAANVVSSVLEAAQIGIPA